MKAEPTTKELLEMLKQRYNERQPEQEQQGCDKRPWVSLTKEEILSIGRELGLKCRLGGNSNIDFDYAHAIDAKLEEKNGVSFN